MGCPPERGREGEEGERQRQAEEGEAEAGRGGRGRGRQRGEMQRHAPHVEKGEHQSEQTQQHDDREAQHLRGEERERRGVSAASRARERDT